MDEELLLDGYRVSVLGDEKFFFCIYFLTSFFKVHGRGMGEDIDWFLKLI